MQVDREIRGGGLARVTEPSLVRRDLRQQCVVVVTTPTRRV
jgi:hypothetical protein